MSLVYRVYFVTGSSGYTGRDENRYNIGKVVIHDFLYTYV